MSIDGGFTIKSSINKLFDFKRKIEQMNFEKVLAFNLFGDFAQFRKHFTNMSPLTFSIPSRTTLVGIIGAIVGIQKNENPEIFCPDKCFIALSIINPPKKIKLPINYLIVKSTKHFSNYENHKPTNVEFLKDAGFRIYFWHSDGNIYQSLKDNLEQHRSFYTVSLGISNCLANFEYLGEFDVLEKMNNNDICSITSVIPSEKVKSIALNEEIDIQNVTLANAMKNNREVYEYKSYLYEATGKPICVNIDNFIHIPDLRINVHGL